MIDVEKYVRKHIEFGHINKHDESAKVLTVLNKYGLQYKALIRGIQVDEYQATLTHALTDAKIKSLAGDIRIAVQSDNVTVTQTADVLTIDVPANSGETLVIGDMITTDEYKQHTGLTLTVGQSVSGQNIYIDLAKMPHILVAGTTGGGKSMFLHSCICSLLIKYPDIEIIGVDTKRVEFQRYSIIPSFTAIDEVDDAISKIHDLVDVMENRYSMFAKKGYRDIDSAIANGMDIHPIVVVIDEFSDLMLQSRKMVEYYVVRLAQKARAAGIHLIIGTQRPSRDVVTGQIKSNLPCKICLKVNSGIDSRIILDHMGGEKLIGKGDLLLSLPGEFKDIRCQGVCLSEDEINNIIVLAYRATHTEEPQDHKSQKSHNGFIRFLKWVFV